MHESVQFRSVGSWHFLGTESQDDGMWSYYRSEYRDEG